MLTNLSVSRALAQGKIVVSVDESRSSGDPFKLPSHLRALIEADIAALEIGNSGTYEAERDPVEATCFARAAFEKLEALLRLGYNGIGAIVGSEILPTGITPADRLGVYTTYGWENGRIGRFTDERLLILGELAVQGETLIATPAWRYGATLVHIVQSQLDIIEEEESIAIGGHRQMSVADRITLLDLLENHLSRARYHYCCASDDLDTTKELAKISFQPRRPAKSIAPAADPALANP